MFCVAIISSPSPCSFRPRASFAGRAVVCFAPSFGEFSRRQCSRNEQRRAPRYAAGPLRCFTRRRGGKLTKPSHFKCLRPKYMRSRRPSETPSVGYFAPHTSRRARGWARSSRLHAGGMLRSLCCHYAVALRVTRFGVARSVNLWLVPGVQLSFSTVLLAPT